ncbi:MAG: FAD-dependent oxidoreductase [Polyangiales bacterium]
MGSETIIIGGGLGGLCAAALLAQRGQRVTLLERGSALGGRARSQTEAGFTFNLGAHALYLGGPACTVLSELGVSVGGKRAAGRGVYVERAGQLHALPQSPLGLLTSDLLTARGKLQVMALLATLGPRKERALTGSNVRSWLDAATPDPSARALLELLVRLTSYAHAPELLGAEMAARQLAIAVRRGVMYVDGGWQSLVDEVERRARSLGVRIELGCPVRNVAREAKGFTVSLDAGKDLHTDTVVAAVDPHALARLLPDDPWAANCAAEATPLRAACLDVGVHDLPHPERINVLSLDAPVYYANHAAYAQVAPAGAATLQLVRYLAPDEDGRGAEDELHAFLDRTQPGVLARAASVRFLPSLTVHHDAPGRGRAGLVHPRYGSFYNVSDQASTVGVLLDGVLGAARQVADSVAGSVSDVRSRAKEVAALATTRDDGAAA